jgi:hypothetical protein
MGDWSVDATSEPGILRLRLVGSLTEEEMRAFVAAHNEAIDRMEGTDYRVWCDVSELNPLSMDQAALFESAKRHSASKPNFRGSAVKVSSALIALQHRRTSTESGVMSTELISSDEEALRAHLKRVHRGKVPSAPSSVAKRPPDKR